MNKALLIGCVATAIASAGPLSLHAQAGDIDAGMRLENLRLSGPPALSLLGVTDGVSRPNTPRDLIASLVSGAGTEGIVPDGYSLETAPFWLTRRRQVSIRDYYGASLGRRLLYFTSISVATSHTRPREDEDEYDANAAIAVRTLLANGRPNPQLTAAAAAMREQQLAYIQAYRQWEAASPRAAARSARRRRLAQQENLLSTLTARALLAPDPRLRDSTLRTLARRDSLRELVNDVEEAGADTAELNRTMERIENRLSEIAEEVAAQELEPDGFILEVAAGTRARFPGGSWGRHEPDGHGLWITPMYRLGSRGIEIIGVARYILNVSEFRSRNVADFGARIGTDIGKGALSAEHVWRSLHGGGVSDGDAIPGAEPERKKTTRWAFLFDYPLSGKLRAVASFGSDYRRPAGDRPLIATIGLNLGLGAIELVPTR